MLGEFINSANGLTVLNKTIRGKFLKYYPDEDLKKWFDPLELRCTVNQGKTGFPLCPHGQENESQVLAAAIKNLQVNFPHPLFADWFKVKFLEKFEHTLFSCLGEKPKITYSCPGKVKIENMQASPAALQSANALKFREVENQQQAESLALEYSFSNFIYNRKNQFPVAAAQKFAANKGHLLFILNGDSGSGKSHLLYAIYNELSSIVNKKYIFFDNLDKLATIFSNTSKNGESSLLYFRDFKYIILDDLDDAALKPELQDYLARVLEYAHERRIYCALILKQKPGDSSFLNEKLRSLLESGLIIELKKPDLDIRRQYVDNCCNLLNLQIKKDDALALARMYSGFRQIYGALLKVAEFKVLSPQAAEAKLADILQAKLGEGQNRLTPDHIIATVGEYLGVSAADVAGKIRKQNAVLARHISMYLCRELLGAQFGHIGACFSDRDHSSVLYSVNKIKRIIKSNKDTNNLVTEVKNLCLK